MNKKTEKIFEALRDEEGIFWRRSTGCTGPSITPEDVCPFCGDKLIKCEHRELGLTPVEVSDVPICPGCNKPGYGHYSTNAEGLEVCNACAVTALLEEHEGGQG